MLSLRFPIVILTDAFRVFHAKVKILINHAHVIADRCYAILTAQYINL